MEQELISSMVCPNGFAIQCEDCLTSRYVADREAAVASGDLKPLIEKWRYLLSFLVGKEKMDTEILVPPELLKIAMEARRFGVPEGVIFFQLINAGVWTVDREGYVRANLDFKMKNKS